MTEISEKKSSLYVRVDLEPMAQEIELLFGEDLRDPPAGIYSSSQVEPVMLDGKTYYVKDPSSPKGVLNLIKISNINEVCAPVFDEEGKCVIGLHTIKNKATQLSNSPMLPYHGIKIARLLHDWTIDSRIRWRRHSANYTAKIQQFLKKESHAKWAEDVIEEYTLPFLDEVNATTGELLVNHEWHVFFLKQSNTTLTVERGEDYRILDWMKRYSAGEIKL